MNTNFAYMTANFDAQESAFIQHITKELTEDELKSFLMIYQNKRRDSLLILITTILGFVGFAGIQRFLTDKIGMGLLYFFTGGLCMIGTIVDLVNYKSLTFEYNQQAAYDTLQMVALYKR